MGSIEWWPHQNADPALLDQQFSTLQRMFYRRLRNEQGQLFMLRVALVEDDNPAPLLDEIRCLAHRMSGAAAIFEAQGIQAAASRVEQAALSALRGLTAQGKASVDDALGRLIEALKVAAAR
jgi:HPt (histidine-containing phosphotransfer) domain-containing protein